MESLGAPPYTGLRARLSRLDLYADRPGLFLAGGGALEKPELRFPARPDPRLRRAPGKRRGEPGRAVLIQGPGHPDWVEALLGTFLAGGVAVPLDESSTEEFRREVARRTGSRLLFAPPEVPAPPGCRRIDLGGWGESAPPVPEVPADEARGERTAEIVFTSGTTGEPRGVVLTHANIASDFASIERGFLRRESMVRSIGPLRFLTTLPLSHMFGQALNVFLPLFMGLTVVFVPPRPREVLEAARRFRPWGLFTVPRLMDLLGHEVRLVLREEGRLESTLLRQERFSRWPFYLQALLFRRVRRIFGWRFRLLVAGGAPLPEAVQQFWERFGFLVVQGYGLTETAPIVSVSNPFRRLPGSVGRPLGVQEVTLGPGNEVLVRGPNVMRGYFGMETSGEPPGWFRTGDIGEFDREGHLRIRGRLKDMIVTPEGENVYPQDVEAAFARVSGVREACVLGIPDAAGEHVHAVLLLREGVDPEEVVRSANERLLPRQRARDHTVWNEDDFPRTSTGKVRKGIVRELILSSRAMAAPAGSADGGSDDVRRLVARVAKTRPGRIGADMRLVETLGLASLDLVELAVALEEEFGVVLQDESLSTATVGDLEQAVRELLAGRPSAAREARADTDFEGAKPPPAGFLASPPSPARRAATGSLRMPRWARLAPIQLLRRLLEEVLYRPVVFLHAHPETVGIGHLQEAIPPYLFVCNHRSYLDTGLFKTALPRPIRGRIAPAMTTRYQRVFFGEKPGGRARYALEWLQVRLAEFLFGVWPLPETAGLRQSLSYAGELMDSGVSLLIFPEGRHVPEGAIEPFRHGIGIFARELRAPVIPACVEGTARVLPDKARWPRVGRTRLVLGKPLFIDPRADPAETARLLEAAVRELEARLPAR